MVFNNHQSPASSFVVEFSYLVAQIFCLAQPLASSFNWSSDGVWVKCAEVLTLPRG